MKDRCVDPLFHNSLPPKTESCESELQQGVSVGQRVIEANSPH